MPSVHERRRCWKVARRSTHDRHAEYRLAFGCAWSYLSAGPIERLVRSVLHDFLTSKRQEIIARTKSKVAARSVPQVTETELVHGVPLFIEQLIAMLKDSERTSDDVKATAAKHGNDMLRMGF